VGIALIGRLHLNVGNQFQLGDRGFFSRVGTVGLHDLDLIALAFVAAIAGIWIGRVLQGVRENFFGRLDLDLH
jgi:hypothetical protein